MTLFFKKRVIRAALSLGLWVFVSACSNGGGNRGASDKKYGNAEKAVEVATNFNRVQKVANSHSKNNSKASTELNDINLITTTVENGVDQKMSRAIDTGSCHVESEEPKINKDQPLDFSMRMKINGEKCPLKAFYNIQNRFILEDNKIDMKMNMEINFEILSPDLAKENDIYSAAIQGGISVVGSNDSGTVNGKTTGIILSNKYGKIQLEALVNGGGSRSDSATESRLTLTIQDEITELVEKVASNNGVSKSEYFLNGKSISEKEFDNFKRKLGLLAQGISSEQTKSDDSDDSRNSDQPEGPGNPKPPVHPTPTPPPTFN